MNYEKETSSTGLPVTSQSISDTSEACRRRETNVNIPKMLVN